MATFGNTLDAYALDPTTGLPLPGVELYAWADETGGTPLLSLLSGLDGAFGWEYDTTADGQWISAGLTGPRVYVPANDALATRATTVYVDERLATKANASTVGTISAKVDTTETRVGTVEDDLAGRLSAPTLAATFLRAINVKTGPYNAKGDGVTDDTAAIQAALDAVSPALGVMTVVIPSGTYMIDAVNENTAAYGQANETRNRWVGGGIKPQAGTTLLLAPDAILKAIPNGSPAYSVVYLGRDRDHVTIRGGQILGDRAAHNYTAEPTYTTHEFGYGIAVRGATDLLVEDVTITGCTGDSIYLAPEGLIGVSPYYPAERVVIRGCTLDGCRRNNLSVIGGDHITIENNLITRAGVNDGVRDGIAPKFGIDLEGYGEGSVDYEIPTRITIRGNRFKDNVSGAVMNFDGYEVVIDGNWSDGFFNYGSGTETVITNNVLVNTANTTGSAISANTASALNCNTLIANNVIKGFGTGIAARNQGVTVTGNLVTGFANVGIGVSTNAVSVTVTGNHIKDGAAATSQGINISQTTACLVADNTIYNVRTGILVDLSSTKIIVQGNQITKAYQGVKVAGTCQVTIRDNTLDTPGHSAGETYSMAWDAGTAVLCQNNQIRNSSTYPISAVSSVSGRSRIIGNQFVDVGSPISCSGGRHEIIGNTFIGYKTSGGFTTGLILLGASTDKALLLKNTSYHSGTVTLGSLVYINGATNTRIVGNTHVGTAIVGGTAAGNEVTSNNDLVAP